MFKRAFYSTMALLLAAPALAKVDAVDGYVRLLPPGSPNTAAFMPKSVRVAMPSMV